jgi:hypothetical protein
VLQALAEAISAEPCPGDGAWTFLRELDERVLASGVLSTSRLG